MGGSGSPNVLRAQVEGSRGYAVSRRDRMTPLEIAEARAIKARLRCGWQTLSDVTGRCVEDLRRDCDFERQAAAPAAPAPPPAPRPVPVAAVAAPRAGPSRPGINGRAARPASALHLIPQGAAVLAALRALSAIPGFAPRPAAAIARVVGATAAKVGLTLRSLREMDPPLVECSREAGAKKFRVWRLTAAGLTAAQAAGDPAPAGFTERPRQVSKMRSQGLATARAVLAALAGGATTQAGLVQRLGISQMTASSHLRDLIAHELVWLRASHGPSQPGLYVLTAAGRLRAGEGS